MKKSLIVLTLVMETIKNIQNQYWASPKMIMELHVTVAHTADATGQVPGRPILDSAAEGNQNQENGQNPPQMPAMKEESATPVIPQL